MIRPADARLKASIMISSSMIDCVDRATGRLDEEHVLPRTLSRMRTKMFSFANWKTSAWPGSLFSQSAIFRASSGLALPW